jgi:hypothetical protein
VSAQELVRDFVVSARFLATEHAELAWRCVLPCQVMVAVGSLLTGLVGGARDLPVLLSRAPPIMPVCCCVDRLAGRGSLSSRVASD